jgi:hypothetical protein
MLAPLWGLLHGAQRAPVPPPGCECELLQGSAGRADGASEGGGGWLHPQALGAGVLLRLPATAASVP